MKNILLLVLCCISNFAVSQNLEETIYTATETFIADKNLQSFNKLSEKEAGFKSKISTKNEQLAYVFLLCNKAYYLKENNELNAAITNYETAWKRFDTNRLATISNYNITEYCLKPLGNLYTKTNNYTAAENTIKQYMALAKKNNDHAQHLAGVVNLAVLYQSRGMHQAVVSLINKNQNNTHLEPKQKNKLETLKASSLIALNKTPDDRLNNNGLKNKPDQYNTLQLEYKLALKKGNYQLALKHFNKSKQYQNQDSLTKRSVAKNHVEEAQLYFLLNKNAKAKQNLQLALQNLLPNLKSATIPETTSLYAENTFIDIFDLLARLQNHTETALQYYDLSFYVSNMLAENFMSQESQITNQAVNRKRSEYCIALLFEKYQNNQDTLSFKRALHYAESYKANTLKAVINRKTLLEKNPNDSLLLKQQELLKKQEQLTNTLIKTQLGYQTTPVKNLNKDLLDLNIDLKALDKLITAKYPQEKPAINISKIQTKLKTDQASLIRYFYGNSAVYQFIISPKKTTFLKTAITDSFKKNISRFIHLFDNASAINNNIPEFTSQAFKMYQSLHLDKIDTSENLVIIPDGILNFMPFEALLTKKIHNNNFSKMPFLIKEQQVVYNSNLSLYLQKHSFTEASDVLGVFPVFKNSNQPLTHSINEAKALKNETDATVLMNSEATKERFMQLVSKYAVIHISTHATGGNFVNPASLAFYDKPMLLNELYSLNINPNLVVLSACETGVGKLQKGAGAMSIARGFQYAGAKNILFSLWQINDASTANLMTLFYKSYKKTKSASIANRQSKLGYLQNKSISNIKKSPYYWSAFVYYGDITLETEKNTTIYYLITSLALLVVVFFIYKKTKNDA